MSSVTSVDAFSPMSSPFEEFAFGLDKSPSFLFEKTLVICATFQSFLPEVSGSFSAFIFFRQLMTALRGMRPSMSSSRNMKTRRSFLSRTLSVSSSLTRCPRKAPTLGMRAATRTILVKRLSLVALEEREATRMSLVSREDRPATNALLVNICWTSHVSGSNEMSATTSSQKYARKKYFFLAMHWHTTSATNATTTTVDRMPNVNFDVLLPKSRSKSGTKSA
mmetsp:Transcript_70341/g.132764  ORF Transcript_70341/g.132764 Transcript_70341/m.132764 type:complete len:222 (+) Transcript_70341:466-1131(+)